MLENDIIINKDGKVDVITNNDPVDNIFNEDRSKVVTINKNADGTSKIGLKVETLVNIVTPGGSAISTTYTSLEISDNALATQVFEFMADKSNVEIMQESFTFSDGKTENIISNIRQSDIAISIKEARPGGYTFDNRAHSIINGTETENAHSHPLSQNPAPSGYNSRFQQNGPPVFVVRGMPDNDKRQANPAVKNYAYSPEYKATYGGGYIRYDQNTAVFTGTRN